MAQSPVLLRESAHLRCLGAVIREGIATHSRLQQHTTPSMSTAARACQNTRITNAPTVRQRSCSPALPAEPERHGDRASAPQHEPATLAPPQSVRPLEAPSQQLRVRVHPHLRQGRPDSIRQCVYQATDVSRWALAIQADTCGYDSACGIPRGLPRTSRNS
jgi:hypothetical protein